MATQGSIVNESAATLQWLVAQLVLGTKAGPVQLAWSAVRERMLWSASNGQRVLQMVDWVSDFWVARGAVPAPLLNQLSPSWAPPDDLTQWPAFDAESVIALFADKARTANHDAFVDLCRQASAPSDPDVSAAAAIAQYVTLKSSLVPRVFDVAAIQTEQARAWLGSAVGHLLMSFTLQPQDNLEAMAGEVVRRLQLSLRDDLQLGMIDDMGDRHLETLYNARILPPDGRLRLGALRIGQGEEWRDHWLALCFELETPDVLDAVQMSARLMRCRSLVLGLGMACASSSDPLKTLALATTRRWLLTLQVMAWLETALRRSWMDVRPKDLCCFALNATKPDWPRRVVAISHRSKDVKPELRQMRAWRASRFAIDANYAPSWETNTGMIWGLFAATPIIARVHSPTYRDSLWCRREIELTNYVLKESDFLTKRWIIDIDQREVRKLDAVVQMWDRPERADISQHLPEFPPLTEVCSPNPMPIWEVRMLRASAALRLLHAVIPGATPDLINELALHLQSGLELPGPAPTNNPDGWRAYGEILREANEVSGAAPNALAVRLPDNYGQSDRELDLANSQRVPDLQTGSPPLRDVLAAMEWLRVEYPQYLERQRGDFLAINCERLSKDVWEHREEVSLHRGLAAMRNRLPVPLWIIQLADQDVEFWPLIGDVPIFTEHASAQCAWMVESSFDRSESQQRYALDSGMILAPALAEKCRRDQGDEA